MLIKLQLTPTTFSPSTARNSILVINNFFLFQVEITKTTQLMTFIVHSVRNYIGF